MVRCIDKSNNIHLEFFCFMNNKTLYNKYTCDICGTNYHEKYNDSNYNDSLINCYETLDGYYLYEDGYISIYKPCYISSKKCNKGGNDEENNCIVCNDGYKYAFDLNSSIYSNCYKDCPNTYFYNDTNINKLLCT